MQCSRLGVGTVAAGQAIPYAFSHGQVIPMLGPAVLLTGAGLVLVLQQID